MYTACLVTYIDVLGFREIIAAKAAPEINRILQRLTTESKPDSEFAAEYSVSFHSFSDLVVRVTDLLSESNKTFQIGILFHELLDLAYAQARLAHDGVLIRGAVTIGHIHSDGHAVFGPALVRAYELESVVAVYPRIVIDPDVLRAHDETAVLKASIHDHATSWAHVRGLLRESENGLFFIDYLRVMAEEDPDSTAHLMTGHRDLIKRLARPKRGSDSVLLKLSWLARYHNQVARELSLPKTFEVRKMPLYSGQPIPDRPNSATEPATRKPVRARRSSS